jgi:hypothetical protein
MTRSEAPKNPFFLVLSLLFIIESLFSAVEARPETPATDARKPFDTITLTVQVVGATALGSFTDYWDPLPGGRVDVVTPVHAGIARAGVHVFGHDAVDPTVPAFGSVYAYLGWAYEWKLPLSLAGAAGVEMGVAYMLFDDESTDSAREAETELGFGITSQLAYAFTPCWSVLITGDYRQILTYRPIEYVFYGVGLSRTFSTPGWLKEFLE